MAGHVLSFNQAIAHILSFLEISFHSLLFLRNVYSPTIFARRQKWSAPVWECRHPAVRDYIAAAITAIESNLRVDAIESISFVIRAKNGEDIERFVFRFWEVLRGVQTFQQDTPVQNAWSDEELGQYLRAALMSIANSEARLPVISDVEDVSFCIQMTLREDSLPLLNAQMTDKNPWIISAEEEERPGVLLPLRGLDSGIFKLSVAVMNCRDMGQTAD